MPLIKREIEPVLVSQVDIGKDVKNELECVTNFTLASIIRQLGNLGKHAEDIFGDLLQEATGLTHRAKALQGRFEKLEGMVNKLDSLNDSVSLRDINNRTGFQATLTLDVEVVSSPTMPSAMKDTYMKCEKPPPLSELNQFREDGKDGLKMYTDPKFFFERWCNEQRKDIGKKKKKKRKRPLSGDVSRPKKVTTRAEKYKDQARGVEFVDSERSKRKSKVDQPENGTEDGEKGMSKPESRVADNSSDSPSHNTQKQARPSATAPPPPPPPAPPVNGSLPGGEGAMPPPPPPPPLEDGIYTAMNNEGMAYIQPPPPPPVSNGHAPPAAPGGAAPPPPPPPPMPGIGAAPPPPPLPNMNRSQATPNIGNNARASTVSQVPLPVQDTKDGLLSAIKQGMKLRRVSVREKERRPNEPEEKSVEAILRRRIAVELSSDEGSTDDSGGDDSEWDDED